MKESLERGGDGEGGCLEGGEKKNDIIVEEGGGLAFGLKRVSLELTVFKKEESGSRRREFYYYYYCTTIPFDKFQSSGTFFEYVEQGLSHTLFFRVPIESGSQLCFVTHHTSRERDWEQQPEPLWKSLWEARERERENRRNLFDFRAKISSLSFGSETRVALKHFLSCKRTDKDTTASPAPPFYVCVHRAWEDSLAHCFP